MKTAAIIPAYNEEKRINTVIDCVKKCTLIDEIIVVSDGSTDNTYEAVVQNNGLKAIKLPKNLGKGGAMVTGAKSTEAEAILFLDADLVGLTPEHVESLIKPLVEGSSDMTIGIFRGGRPRTDWAQKIAPRISGQRALKKDFFLSVPDLENTRYGVEIAIGRHARKNRLKVVSVPLFGATHIMQEEKLGFIKGTLSRTKMYREIVKHLLRNLKT